MITGEKLNQATINEIKKYVVDGCIKIRDTDLFALFSAIETQHDTIKKMATHFYLTTHYETPTDDQLIKFIEKFEE